MHSTNNVNDCDACVRGESKSRWTSFLFCALVSALVGCQRAGDVRATKEPLAEAVLREQIEPGGTPAKVESMLGSLAKERGMLASLATALDAQAHGKPLLAADSYTRALTAAQGSSDPLAPKVAWMSAINLVGLRGSVAELYRRERAAIEGITRSPGNIGFRALSVLLEWSVSESDSPTIEAEVPARLGCVSGIRFAGPFGHGSGADTTRVFPAETQVWWSESWAPDPIRGTVPRLLTTEQRRCLATAKEVTPNGVFYAETSFEIPNTRDLLVTVQGALRVTIDGVTVLERDTSQWASWQRFGAHVRLGPGRHRVVARLASDTTAIRLLTPQGLPSGIVARAWQAGDHAVSTVEVLPTLNPLEATLASVNRGKAISSLDRFLSASLFHAEGLDDVSAWLMQPLVSAGDATALSLATAAVFARNDPASSEEMRKSNERALHVRAIKQDPKTWFSQAWLVLDNAAQRGLLDAVGPLRTLADANPEEPQVLSQLVRLYGRLGWKAERMSALSTLVQRFPDDTEALALQVEVLEEDGALKDADKAAERIRQLDPDSELELTRALAREDYKEALVQLERLARRRPDRKDIAGKIASVLQRAGNRKQALQQLTVALAKNPFDSGLRLRVADAEFSRGDRAALRRALAVALGLGAKAGELDRALELIEGGTTLEAYRVDGKKWIAQFEAWERSGKRMDGSSARVLDYAAVWIRRDGSHEMLEHEIIRLQSQEAVAKESEIEPPQGQVLRVRVIKANGQTLEPQTVAGKPTLTMPHLEVGDYIETEHIMSQTGSPGGLHYRGPTWFFREADKGYWRSEFVCVSPESKPLQVETRGNVPAAVTRKIGTFDERRWVVLESPPAELEPASPPISEFLPSVRIGWGVDLDTTLATYVDAVVDGTPIDPRLVEQVRSLAGDPSKQGEQETLQRLYRALGTMVQPGRETDGRKVITGKSGSLQSAWIYGLRLLGVPLQFAIVKDKLAMPAVGKLGEVDSWDNLAMRVGKGGLWMTVRDKFTPFGYMPPELRGQPAIILAEGLPRTTTSSSGRDDSFAIDGDADVATDGSAKLQLRHTYDGRLAARLRNGLEQVPPAKLREVIETQLLNDSLPGVKVDSVDLENLKDIDQPLVMKIKAVAPRFAREQGGKLAVRIVFPVELSRYVSLPKRATPLMLGTSTSVDVRLRVTMPSGYRLEGKLGAQNFDNGERRVVIDDRQTSTGTLQFHRSLTLPAGRVQPGEPYDGFARFARAAEAALAAEYMLVR
jgi:cellulose synthase operon protein C